MRKFFLGLIVLAQLIGITRSSAEPRDTALQGREPLPPSERIKDPSLPAVLPGEVVTTDEGDRIKVWSSSGPVAVGAVPQLPAANLPQVGIPNSYGNATGFGNPVIIDARPESRR